MAKPSLPTTYQVYCFSSLVATSLHHHHLVLTFHSISSRSGCLFKLFMQLLDFKPCQKKHFPWQPKKCLQETRDLPLCTGCILVVVAVARFFFVFLTAYMHTHTHTDTHMMQLLPRKHKQPNKQRTFIILMILLLEHFILHTFWGYSYIFSCLPCEDFTTETFQLNFVLLDLL